MTAHVDPAASAARAAPLLHRAYSVIEIKSIDDEERVIEGIASTPRPDRVKDVVEPMGAVFKTPMPLLLDHNSREQVGHVEFAKPNKDGIPFKARIQKVLEPGEVKDLVDKAWHLAKYKLRQFVSIGFKPLEGGVARLKSGGDHFTSWEWLELSLVSVPSQPDAVITQLKSLDADLLAASGRGQESVTKTSAGVTASKPTRLKATEAKKMPKPYADRIRDTEKEIETKQARMDELMDAADERGETLGGAEKQEWDNLAVEVKDLKEHRDRQVAREKSEKERAVPVDAKTQDDASKSRQGVRVQVKSPQLPPGIMFTRYCIAKHIGVKDQRDPIQVCKERWPDMPEMEAVFKAAVAPGTVTDSTWAGPLAPLNNASSEFIEYLWPRTVVGRIPGLTRVPFRTKIPRQTAVAAVNWVGENKPKPVGAGAFDTVELPNYKIAGIVALTEELVRFSDPSAELLSRNMLANGVIKLMDQDFLDPDKAVSANISPASITNGVTPVAATGTAYANFVADIKSVMSNFDDVELSDDIVVVMRTGLARSMGLMLNALGQNVFPGLSQSGGTMAGFPVVTTTNIQYTEDSAAEGSPIIFIHAPSILFADDGQVRIDISREASVQMDSAPTDPPAAATVLISFWQLNLVGIRAERMVAWVKARTGAVQMISAAKYA